MSVSVVPPSDIVGIVGYLDLLVGAWFENKGGGLNKISFVLFNNAGKAGLTTLTTLLLFIQKASLSICPLP